MKKVINNFVLVTAIAIYFPLWASNPDIETVRNEIIKMRSTGRSINEDLRLDVEGEFLISADNKYIMKIEADLGQISSNTPGELIWHIVNIGFFEKYYHFYVPYMGSGYRFIAPQPIDVFYNSQGYSVYPKQVF